ncbi:Protein TOXD [Penicillium angulare]|uniref:Protein TOXD n=1 Tax=Penicillium angulare TaxID=116970 RepID=UPI0025410D89|nr:Protein TOXD [Penicillium angulare]KAJ5260573.1 Protein TOXD [Penicillium angulare]
MAAQKAIIVTSPKQEGLVTDRGIPALRDDYILVKTEAVALNPTDWKHIKFLSPPGTLVGCDYTGVVQEVGNNVKKSFKKGDRVCGFVHGGNAVQPEDGAFAEYIVAKGDIQMRIPDNLNFQQAATLGVGITTVGQALYQSLNLCLPSDPFLLIYSGSTATGALAIQFAKLSGYTVLATCSPQNFDMVRSLGADRVFNYHDPQSAEEIRAYTCDQLRLVLDTISTEGSAAYCDSAILAEGGEYSALLDVGIARANVNDRCTLAYSAIGEEFMFGDTPWPASSTDIEFAVKIWTLAEQFLADGKIKVHRPKFNCGGLSGVLEGLQILKENRGRGEKFVHNMGESS